MKEVKLTYGPVCPSVSRWVGWSVVGLVGRPNIMSQKGEILLPCHSYNNKISNQISKAFFHSSSDNLRCAKFLRIWRISIKVSSRNREIPMHPSLKPRRHLLKAYDVIQHNKKPLILLLEVELSYDPICPSIGWLVGWSVQITFQKGGKLRFHAPIGTPFLLSHTRDDNEWIQDNARWGIISNWIFGKSPF